VRPQELAYLFSLTNEHRSIKYDLRNMRALVEALDHPEDAFHSVLIAGTNGKGSVAAFLSAMMPDAGLYTSPHLMRLNERFRIGDSEISDADLKEVFDRVQEAVRSAKGLLQSPSYFEIVTAMAFMYFRNRVNFAVLEVGLGGRLDATNVVRQDVSVITNIALDHEQFLGSTLLEVAAEKAGIIKGFEPVVIGPEAEYDPIRERAGEKLFATKNVERMVRPLGDGNFEVDVVTPIRQYRALRPGLAGRHQIDNMIVAIRTAECLKLSQQSIENGIGKVRWPGRLERFEGKPAFLLDGAHNPHGARALAAFLKETYPDGVWMIFGAMADKKHNEMLSVLAPRAQKMIFTSARSSRAKDPRELQALVPGSHVEPTVPEAIEYARSHCDSPAPIVVCGTLYLIGEARSVLQ
jgi:dihydrofolate synthase/folylpolyglutamate synthase